MIAAADINLRVDCSSFRLPDFLPEVDDNQDSHNDDDDNEEDGGSSGNTDDRDNT